MKCPVCKSPNLDKFQCNTHRVFLESCEHCFKNLTDAFAALLSERKELFKPMACGHLRHMAYGTENDPKMSQGEEACMQCRAITAEAKLEAATTPCIAPEAPWRCFHCDFCTSVKAEAEAHFGERDDAEEFTPICKWWAQSDEQERVRAHQDLLVELAGARDSAITAEAERDALIEIHSNPEKYAWQYWQEKRAAHHEIDMVLRPDNAKLREALDLTYLTLREYQDDPVLLGCRLRIQRAITAPSAPEPKEKP